MKSFEKNYKKALAKACYQTYGESIEEPSEDDQTDGRTVISSVKLVTLWLWVFLMYATIVIDAALIDTGSSILATVEKQLVPACLAANVHRTRLEKSKSRSITGKGGQSKSEGTIYFLFYFGGRIYSIEVNVVPGISPLIFSQRDIVRMCLNYQSMYKLIERPDDGYFESVDWRRNITYLVFSSYGNF